MRWAGEPSQLEQAWRAISARDDHGHKLWIDDYLAASAQARIGTFGLYAGIGGAFRPMEFPEFRPRGLPGRRDCQRQTAHRNSGKPHTEAAAERAQS